MLRIGLIRERKTPPDERVAFTPRQCVHVQNFFPDVKIVVEPSPIRCYSDAEYLHHGIEVNGDLSDCDVLIGIKEQPVEALIAGKTYFFFSHTKKKQPHNKKLMHGLIEKGIRMIDYECLTHHDEQRILGFGFYAGIVGAYNGLRTYGKKFDLWHVPPAHELKSYENIIEAYADIRIPPLKIVLTGSGRVASGVIDMMHHLDVEMVEPEDFLSHQYDYPVFTHLKGSDLYARKDNALFHRNDFHANPDAYHCKFSSYISQTDILMNGIYWDNKIARLFEKEDIRRYDWRISVVADITCDVDGSVPINIESSTIADPVYGVDKETFIKTEPYRNSRSTIDMMAVDNLPNELPRDASKYFGTHLEKFIIPELMRDNSDILQRATICMEGRLTKKFEYLADYAYGE